MHKKTHGLAALMLLIALSAMVGCRQDVSSENRVTPNLNEPPRAAEEPAANSDADTEQVTINVTGMT